MITLNNKLGNPVWIDPNKITMLQLCCLSEDCPLTYVQKPCEKDMAIKVHFDNGQSLIVRDCYSDIETKILEHGQ